MHRGGHVVSGTDIYRTDAVTRQRPPGGCARSPCAPTRAAAAGLRRADAPELRHLERLRAHRQAQAICPARPVRQRHVSGHPRDCAACHGVGPPCALPPARQPHPLDTDQCGSCCIHHRRNPAVNFDHTRCAAAASTCHTVCRHKTRDPPHRHRPGCCDVCHTTLQLGRRDVQPRGRHKQLPPAATTVWCRRHGMPPPHPVARPTTPCEGCHSTPTSRTWGRTKLKHLAVTGDSLRKIDMKQRPSRDHTESQHRRGNRARRRRSTPTIPPRAPGIAACCHGRHLFGQKRAAAGEPYSDQFAPCVQCHTTAGNYKAYRSTAHVHQGGHGCLAVTDGRVAERLPISPSSPTPAITSDRQRDATARAATARRSRDKPDVEALKIGDLPQRTLSRTEERVARTNNTVAGHGPEYDCQPERDPNGNARQHHPASGSPPHIRRSSIRPRAIGSAVTRRRPTFSTHSDGPRPAREAHSGQCTVRQLPHDPGNYASTFPRHAPGCGPGPDRHGSTVNTTSQNVTPVTSPPNHIRSAPSIATLGLSRAG